MAKVENMQGKLKRFEKKIGGYQAYQEGGRTTIEGGKGDMIKDKKRNKRNFEERKGN